jgi:SAM-dependent methyltransferase
VRVADASDWLTGHLDLLPSPGLALDVASGRGRHTRLLAGLGWRVHAVDRDAAALADLARAGLPGVSTSLIDLEANGVSLGTAAYDLVLVFNYLHRPLFPAIAAALCPGGLLSNW